jgi:hypothetical protein
MLGLRRGSAAKLDCGGLELRFALEIPDMARGKHRSKIEEIRGSHPHTVAYCKEQPIDGVCLSYALGLIGEQAYEDIAMVARVLGLPGEFYGTDLANWLLDGRLVEIDEEHEGALDPRRQSSSTWSSAVKVGHLSSLPAWNLGSALSLR